MPLKYLLPCSCGAQVPIDLGQAGQLLTCECGATLNVPTMREISRLKTVEVADSARPVANWSGLQGLLFAAGLLLMIVALVLAGLFGYGWSRIPILTQPTDTDTEAWAEQVLEKARPDELIDHWHEIESRGLGQWHPPEHVVAREMRATLLRNTILALAAAAAGLCLIVSSLMLKRSPPREADD